MSSGIKLSQIKAENAVGPICQEAWASAREMGEGGLKQGQGLAVVSQLLATALFKLCLLIAL